MAGQVSPGIVLRERDLTNSVAVATQANTAAIVGAFEKGPVGVITSITTERQLLDTFGKPNANNFEDWYVAATFLSYGGQLQVVRVADTALKNAVTNYDTEESNAPLITSYADFEAQQGTTTYKFAARTAGTWGNGLKVSVIDGSVTALAYSTATYHGTAKWSTLAPRPANSDTCHVAVIDEGGSITGTPGTLLETFLYVSRLTTAVNSEGETNYYPNVVNRRSRYVYADELVTAGEVELSLDGGVDSYQVGTSSIETALEQFNDVENINIDFILAGGSITYGGTPGDATKTKALKAISIAANRKDCIAFVSPYRSFVNLTDTAAQKQAIIDYFSNMTSTSYAVFDSGYKYIYDRYNDVYRYIPCCGDVAGLCVQTSVTLEDWFSPAGLQRGNLRNAVKLAYTPTKTDRDELYQNRINPITAFPGQGIVLFGDKTALSTPSAFDRINVRRLFLAIQRRVASVARNVLFELNDTTTRNSFFTTVNAYMAEVQAKRGVTDYLVVCDETNNTPEVIDRNEFVAEIYVKPARSINYVTITFVATKTGVSFEEVTGQV
jgi:hypothetical protein